MSDSKTLREIQAGYGLTGAFKDRPIAEWLGKYNTNPTSFEKVIFSCCLGCYKYLEKANLIKVL